MGGEPRLKSAPTKSNTNDATGTTHTHTRTTQIAQAGIHRCDLASAW